jgi:hypothetical protein
MNVVKKEEDPTPLGFSATRLGMERSIEKQRFGMPGGTPPTAQKTDSH